MNLYSKGSFGMFSGLMLQLLYYCRALFDTLDYCCSTGETALAPPKMNCETEETEEQHIWGFFWYYYSADAGAGAGSSLFKWGLSK
jgi:hypothetical protein